MYFGHAGEEHAVEPAASWWTQLLHRPTWVGVLTVALVMATLYLITRQLRLPFTKRLLVLVASMIILGVLYLPHNATVTGIVLSIGFITTFLLTFTLLARPPKQ